MTTFQYEAKFRVNLGKAVPAVGELMEELNTHLSTMGCDETLSLTHDAVIPPLIVTVDRELTQEEQRQMKVILEAEMIKAFPKYDVRLTSFGRKPVTPELSVA